MNRRLAEHKTRKGIAVVDQDSAEEAQTSTNSRAAAAAARVAARYAKTPSYSEMQAAEARGALRAAEAATRAALEAQAAAQAVLDHIESEGDQAVDVVYEEHGRAAESSRIAESVRTAEVSSPEKRVKQADSAKRNEAANRRTETATAGLEIRWEADMPVRHAQHQMRAERAENWESEPDGAEMYEAVEAAQPIVANLIEFPREIIATRRMRPRITEAFVDADEPQQLSIFEVEPNSISTEPMGAAAMTAEEPTWIGSSWQQIELEDHPQALPDYYAIAPDAPKLYQAPFSRRMMATMVDAALILCLVWGTAYLVASHFDHLPSLRISETLGVIATLGFAALYEWFFLTVAKVTPGMRYAQLSLCTFDEEVPTAAQVKGRMKAMLISVLPAGLGVVWSIFDEDQMSWHDRLSKTYLRLS